MKKKAYRIRSVSPQSAAHAAAPIWRMQRRAGAAGDNQFAKSHWHGVHSPLCLRRLASALQQSHRQAAGYPGMHRHCDFRRVHLSHLAHSNHHRGTQPKK